MHTTLEEVMLGKKAKQKVKQQAAFIKIQRCAFQGLCTHTFLKYIWYNEGLPLLLINLQKNIKEKAGG